MVLRAIASALGTPLESMLARAGVLEDSEKGDPQADLRETEAAILADPELSEPQRTALLSVDPELRGEASEPLNNI